MSIPGGVKREHVKNLEKCNRILRSTLPESLLPSFVGRPNLYFPYCNVSCDFAHLGPAAFYTTCSCPTYDPCKPHVIPTSNHLHPSNPSSTTLLIIQNPPPPPPPPPLNLELNSNLPLNISHTEPTIVAVRTREVGVLSLDLLNRNLAEASLINPCPGTVSVILALVKVSSLCIHARILDDGPTRTR